MARKLLNFWFSIELQIYQKKDTRVNRYLCVFFK